MLTQHDYGRALALDYVTASLLLVLFGFAAVRLWIGRGPHKLPRVLPGQLGLPPEVTWSERLFLGRSRDWLGRQRFAFGAPEDCVAVLGPPRISGKTAGIVIPQAAMWAGPLISTSTRPDVLRATAGRRQELARKFGGNVYVYAPTEGETVEGLPAVHWSPLAGCQDPRVATLRVETLVSVTQVGRNVENADHWRAGASRILRPYFLAAANHPTRPGDFSLVREWLSLHEFKEPLSILTRLGTEAGFQWAAELVGVVEKTPDKERGSFFSSAANTVKATADPTVLRSASGTDLDPVEFLQTRSTLYIVSPSEHQEAVAPLLTALISSIVTAAYELHRAGRLPARLLASLDEVANIAPLPELESMLSQGASQGVNVCWVAQSLAQIRNRYGQHTADAIWSSTTAKIVFGGLADGTTLDQLSRLAGDHRVATRSSSTDHAGRTTVTRSFEWRPRLSPAEIRGLRPRWALLFYHHRKPCVLKVPIAARSRRMRRAFMPWPVEQLAPLAATRLHVVKDGERVAANGADAAC